jgi:glycosyltransferase involved in cell wall biosynthesis
LVQEHQQRVHGIEQALHELQQQGQAVREQSEALLHQMQQGQPHAHDIEQQVQQLRQHVLAVGDQVQVLREGLPTFRPVQVQALKQLTLLLLVVLAPVLWLVRFPRRLYRLLRQVGKVLFMAKLLAAAFLPVKKRSTEHGQRILMLATSQIAVDSRINKVARTLARHGYDVDIMCYQHWPGITTVLEEAVRPGVRYIRVPQEAKWQDSRRLLHFWFQEEFCRVGSQRTYDYVHANDLTTLLAGWLLARGRGVPLIYDAHEMWSENVSYDGQEWVPMPLWLRRLARCFEGFLVRSVARLITVSPSICTEMQRRYKIAQTPYLLANYPELALLHGKQRTLPSIRALCGLTDDHFVTLYLGGVNPLRNIENVIQAHQYLPEECVFVIRGPGVDEYGRDYQALAQALGLEQRIFCLPPVAMDEVIGGAAGADCGIVMLRNICKNFYWFYPNKFFEYMLAGLPVAVSHFPDVTAHVEREKCGVVFDPDSPQSIAEALQWLYEHPEEAQAMGRRGCEGVLREYNWDKASATLLQAYRTLSSQGPYAA